MVDARVRDLERALAAGDEGARSPLAMAYLRQGRPREALDLLGEPGAGDPGSDAALPHPGLLDMEEVVWEQAVARFVPITRVPGAQDYGELVGWFRRDGFAALAVYDPTRRRSNRPELRLFDRAAGELVPASVVSSELVPRAVTPAGVICEHWAGGRYVSVTHDRIGGWLAEPALLPGGDQILSVHPAGAYALTAERGAPGDLVEVGVYRPTTGEAGRVVRARAVAIDWARDRLVWVAANHALCMSPLRVGALHAAGPDGPERGDGEEHQVAPPLPRHPECFELLADGRLLVGPPLRILDLTRGESVPVGGRGAAGGVSGPFRLARDRAALLALRAGRPLRIELGGDAGAGGTGGAPAAAGLSAPDERVAGAWWHPRADLVVVDPGPNAQAEVHSVRHGGVTNERRLLRLPPDARPLGWTACGRGLLVVRELGDERGLLELWSTPEAG